MTSFYVLIRAAEHSEEAQRLMILRSSAKKRLRTTPRSAVACAEASLWQGAVPVDYGCRSDQKTASTSGAVSV